MAHHTNHTLCPLETLGVSENDNEEDIREKYQMKLKNIKAKWNSEEDQEKLNIEIRHIEDSYNLLTNSFRRRRYLGPESSPALGCSNSTKNTRGWDNQIGNNEEKENEVHMDRNSEQTTIDVLQQKLLLSEAKLKICEEELESNQMMFTLLLREKDKELADQRLEFERIIESLKHDNDNQNIETPTAAAKDKLRRKLARKTNSSVSSALICDFPDYGQRFAYQPGLSRHRHTVHSNTKYNCPECTYVSRRKDNLVAHMRSLHNTDSEQISRIRGRRRFRSSTS